MKVTTIDTRVLPEDTKLYDTFLRKVYGLENFRLIESQKSFYLKIQFYEDSEKKIYIKWDVELLFMRMRDFIK